MFHRTQRLLLRPVWPEDWRILLVGIADEGVVRNLARAPWPYTEHDAQSFAASPVSDPRFPRFLLTLPGQQGSQLVGCCGIDGREGVVELGYWIARQFWGRGFATEGARAVLDIATVFGHERIVAGHYLDNPASGRVLRKLGFQPTGRTEQRDCLARGRPTEAAMYELRLQAIRDDAVAA
ncbi:MAG: N-acetyltransferase [Sphingomonadaceae bacterium]|nr:MAG: N-acetyltransferase [Sphingomonadaceae bacterium]